MWILNPCRKLSVVSFLLARSPARVIDLPHCIDLGTVELPLSDCLSNTCSSPEMDLPHAGWVGQLQLVLINYLTRTSSTELLLRLFLNGIG